MAYTTIDDPGLFFNPVLYTGTGAELAVTGAGFQPDFTWTANRAATEGNNLFDAPRGVTKYWMTNNNDPEVTNAQSLKSWESDGFTLGTFDGSNKSGSACVSWNWKMGTTSGIDATGAGTTPTGYSFNQTAGQSVILYTGVSVAGGGPATTIPHGLGAAPTFIIVKNYSAASRDTYVYNQALGPTKRIYLNQTTAVSTSSTGWNDTAPTSVLVSIGSNEAVNENTETIVAYCFAPIQGYSKFGSYQGNADADGPFVYTGFKPAWILIKNADRATSSWFIWDNKREGYNRDNDHLYSNSSAVEDAQDSIDILSNGFKIRHSDAAINGSDKQCIYAAFAESPFVNSSGVPSNGR